MRRALIVGVSVYDRERSELAPLRTPVADATALRGLLADQALGRYEEPVLLCDPTCDEFRRKLEAFLTSAAPEDELLFYYSGHGRLSFNGGLLLCASDTEGPQVTSSALKATDIAEWTQLCHAQTLVMILDCCYSGQVFGDGVKGQADEPIKAAIGVALMPGRGKHIITSSTRLQTSLELPDEESSLFTKWLLYGIRTGEADANRDGKISVDELYTFVHRKVIGERKAQTPQYMARAEAPGEVVIAYAADNVRWSSPPPPAALSALERLLGRQWSEGKLVPFIGHSTYGDSKLGQNALATSLQADGMRAIGSSPIATVAEHFCLACNREDLLDQLSTELAAGEAEEHHTVGQRLLQQVAGNERLGLVVVATYDHLFERELDALGRDYVTLTHVLESGPNWHQSVGKLAVVDRGGTSCELFCADKALLPTDRLVVYRPLGSPRLNRIISNYAGRCTDTVVITESDHLVFGRLYPEDAAFPTVLSTRLLGKRLLFLGYTLDVWHYRFVIRMLAKNGNNPEPWAVRQAMDTIESKCWEKLGAKVLDMNLTTLLERVMAPTTFRSSAPPSVAAAR